MTTRAIVILTLPLFVLFVLLRTPVSVVYERFVAERLPDNVAVAMVSGNLWNGRVHGIRIDRHSIGNVGWSLQGIGLFGPAAHFAFDADSDQSHLTGRVSVAAFDSGFTLRDVEGSVDAAMLDIALRQASAKLTGAVELDLVRVEVVPTRPYVGAADGSAVWTAAAVVEPVAVTLGTVVLRMAPAQAGGISGSLRNTGGDVATDGSFRLEGDGQYQLELTARAEAQGGDKVDAILQFGKPTDDGGRQFSFTGSL